MKLENFQNNTSVITTKYVIDDDSDIVYVSLDEEGDLQMFSQEGSDMEKAVLVSLDNIVSKDKSILDIHDIVEGEAFYRKTKNSPWVKVV